LVAVTTSGGLLIIPLLQYASASGVLLIGLALFMCFRYMLRGGNALLATFAVVGLTMISAPVPAAFALALTVIEALAKGLLIAGLIASLSHWVFPESSIVADVAAPNRRGPDRRGLDRAARNARGAAAFLLALIDPSAYMPLIMKSVTLGQQACTTLARDAARELARRYAARRTTGHRVLERVDRVSASVDVLPLDAVFALLVRSQTLCAERDATITRLLAEHVIDLDTAARAVRAGQRGRQGRLQRPSRYG
jgi:hypothetical protein